MSVTRRAILSLAILILCPCLVHVAGQTVPSVPQPAGLRYRMLAAEDARASTRKAAAPILQALASPDSTLVRIAVRALGRLENPVFEPDLRRALNDQDPGVRAEAADALGSLSPADPPGVLRALRERLVDESQPDALGALHAALGRLRYATNDDRRLAEQTLTSALASESTAIVARVGAARGLESLVRNGRSAGFVAAPDTLAVLRREVTGAAHRGAGDDDSLVRRLVLTTLISAGAVDETFGRAAVDRDVQTRRLAVAGVIGDVPTALRDSVVAVGLVDAAPMVRWEALRVHGRHYAPVDCRIEIAFTKDPDPAVALQAIDLLATACPTDAAATTVLRERVRALPPGPEETGLAWLGPSHAMVALAKRDAAPAKAVLASFARHARWQVRMYSARAAALLQDGATLETLASDANGNVREAAIAGLAKVRAHDADLLYLKALDRPDAQVVMAATAALKGTPLREPAATAILKALGALTAQHRDTTRDPRLALLDRLRETGSAANAASLRPYLADNDPRVAALSADILTAWTKRAVAPRTRTMKTLPLPPVQELRDLPVALRFTLESGGAFVVRLFVDESPISVWRVVRLARAGAYDGLTFHRIVPNFIVQGGSPDANEFVGDGPFMRDEFSARSETRGTVGISSRGHDTGDAQFYINLVDNARLDHLYTIFGDITEGMDRADAILEGDTIVRVEVINR